jgi:hypothetical protein
MRFSKVPPESKKSMNRAGQTLVDATASPLELERARELVSRWRACHLYPINTFQSTLRRKAGSYPGDVIVAQRLKRMPTIVDKLKRYPDMKLTTMQDIGGVRAVLRSVRDVYKLAQEYKTMGRFAHELVAEDDYIASPRDEDGYRSLHLIYKYKNNRNPEYDGLRLELQIRTKLQHTWATAVETMGTFLGQALKSRQGDREWIDFFAITGSAFALRENCAPVPRFGRLATEETARAVAEAEARLSALDQMRGFSVAVDTIAKESSGSSYHLIVLNSLERTVEVTSYDRASFEQALEDYAESEKAAAEGLRIEPVLVSAGKIETIRRAYPNFFLDIREFVQIVDRIVSENGRGESRSESDPVSGN